MNRKLRFAALVRVSTERQGKRGESLRTQKKNILQAVEYHDGEVVEWYEGQEHATEGYERKLFGQLLRDAGTGTFNAVIVDDVSRWSRDTLRAQEGLAVLRKNAIRFFVGSLEYDQNMPEPKFFLDMMTSVSQFHASLNSFKAMINKVERAKRGWPTSGKIPYGRKLLNDGDRKSGSAQWEVITEKQKEVLWLYDLYVNKKHGFNKITKITGIPLSTVRAILLLQSGDIWRRSFRIKNKVEHVETKIPPLLDKAQIEAVRRQTKVNPQFRELKYIYPLAHFVRCAECRATLHGQAQAGRKKYYVHDKVTRDRHHCNGLKSVRAEWVDSNVFAQIGKMLSDSKYVIQAIQRVTAVGEETRAHLEGQLDEYRKRQGKLKARRERLLDAIMDGTVLKEEVTEKWDDLRHTISELESGISDIECELQNYDIEIPEDVMERANRLLFAVTGMNGNAVATWSDQEKVKIAKYFFGENNSKLGVFIRAVEHPGIGKFFDYEVKGVLGTAFGAVGKQNLVFLSDIADEQVTTDANLADLAKLLDSLNHDGLPFRKDYGRLAKYKVSSPLS